MIFYCYYSSGESVTLMKWMSIKIFEKDKYLVSHPIDTGYFSYTKKGSYSIMPNKNTNHSCNDWYFLISI